MAIEFGSAEARSVLERDRAMASDDDGWREDGDELGDGDVWFDENGGPVDDEVAGILAKEGVELGAMVQLGFDYSQVDEAYRDEVQAAAQSIHELERGVMGGLIEIGKRLIEVKGMLPHGQFADWCAAEFDLDPRAAQRYMNVAREYGDAQKRHIVSLFSPTVAYMLAAPSTPAEAREEVEQAALNGQKVTVGFAKEAVRKARPEQYTSMQTLENMIREWAHNHAAAKSFALDEVLSFVVEGKSTRADKERRAMATWLAEQGCHWRDGDVERAAKRVWDQRQVGLRQEKAKAVYVEPEEKPESHPDPVVAVLVSENPHSDEFTAAFEAATLEQLMAAQEWLRDAYGPWGKGGYIESTRWNKIGHRRGDLEFPPSPDATPDPEEAAAIAEVEAEREQEEAERLALSGDIDPQMPQELEQAGYSFWRTRDADKDIWGWKWQLDLPGSGGGFGADGDRHFGPFVATPQEAIEGARGDFEQRLRPRPTPEPPAMVTLDIRRELAEKLRQAAGAFKIEGMLLVDQGALEEALVVALAEGSAE